MALPTYNQAIRKIVLAFGDLFNNLTLVRYTEDMTEQERFLVPIAFSAKELYVMRLEGDPNLDKKVQMTLPRISYDLLEIRYDPDRKLNTNVKNWAQTQNGIVSQYNPVPYNFDFELCIYVRNIEDGAQLVEHILPFFTPDYTIVVNMTPELGNPKELPITLNRTHYDVRYEGNRDSDPRMIIWTLNMTVKGFLFGAISGGLGQHIITHTITNAYDAGSADNIYIFNMEPSSSNTAHPYQDYELVYQGPSRMLPTASAKVLSYSNTTNELQLSAITGNFVSNQPIIGVSSGVSHKFLSFQVTPKKYFRVDVVPDPIDATANSDYGFTTTITEYP